MRWRCTRRQPIAAGLRDLLGVFSAFSRRGPPSDPDIAASKRCSHHERYTRLHGCPSNGGAYMFCMLRLTSLALPSLSAALAVPAQDEGTWAIRQNVPCIDCRPAQPLCRVSPIVTRPVVFVRHEARARVHTRDASAGHLEPEVKAHTTIIRSEAAESSLSPLFFGTRRAWRVQQRSSNRHSKDRLNQTLTYRGRRGLAGGAYCRRGFRVRARCVFDTWFQVQGLRTR